MTNRSDAHAEQILRGCLPFFFIFISLVLIVSGCAAPAPTFITLKPENADKLHSVKVYSVLRQSTITARTDYVPPQTGGKSAGMYFGAVGVIVGATLDAIGDTFKTSNRSNSIEVRIAPLRTAISDYDLREEFWSQLRLELKNQTRLNIKDIVTTTQSLSNKERTNIIHDMSEDALLIIDTSYSLSPGFDILSIDSIVSIWPKGEEEKIYLETLNYNSKPLPENGDEAVKKWAENNGERFRNAVQEGTQETFKMLRSKLLD